MSEGLEHPRNANNKLLDLPGLRGHILLPVSTVFVASYKICS
jgi:hypothetical protein